MSPRLRRVHVGRYRDAPAQPLAPVDSVVEDGVIIAQSAVRLTVKNSIILAALRDHVDFDSAKFEGVARAEILRIAAENDQNAIRAEETWDPNAPLTPGIAIDVAQMRRDAYRRRPAIYRMLADALRVSADDPAGVANLVSNAQQQAADELNQAVVDSLSRQFVEHTDDYQAGREDRIRDLIDNDLAKLRRTSE